jgi:glutamate/tyrosine decarboxylase-like PLP-dependent enzyme
MNAVAKQTRPVPSLFYGPEEREKWDDFLTVALSEALQRIPEGPVNPTMDVEVFKQELSDFDFESPRALGELLPWAIEALEGGVVHLTHPRYFGLFNPSPSFPAECAERIVSAFNPQLATSTTSPIAVEMEAHVIRAIAQRAGLPTGSAGHFTSGGTEANFTALTCALTNASPRFGIDGVAAFAGAPTMYVSRDAHLAWHKIAHQSGIGRTSVRLIDVDRTGRMDASRLAEAIAADKANGRVPVMVVATAGTTGAGMIDPLADCAGIARASRAWFHVDAAWGGALIASERLRGALAGIEDADSITMDGHKWFATTMSCGMFITRDAALLSDAFHVSTNYMPSNVQHLDPYVTTVQWSRRFLGLRLFLSLATAGWRGYAEHVERSIELIALLRRELIALGWTIANDSPLAVLCAEPPPNFTDVRSIVREIVASGSAWVSSTVFCDRDVIRMCVTNGWTMPEDIRSLARLLNSSAGSCRSVHVGQQGDR